MRLDIKPFHDEAYGCLDDVVVTIMKWLGRRHEMMFCDAWNFFYAPKATDSNIPLGKRIDLGDVDFGKHYMLEKYHGVKVIKHKHTPASETLELIKNELSSGRPVILRINLHYCIWTSVETIVRNNPSHAIVVTGYDLHERLLYCLDPFMNDQINILPLPVFIEACNEGCLPVTYICTGDETFDVRWQDVIKDAVFLLCGNNGGQNAFESMLELAEEIEISLNLKSEMPGYANYLYSPLIISLVKIYRGRLKFSKALDFLLTQNAPPILADFKQKLEMSAMKWNAVKTLILKMCYLDDYSIFTYKAANKIREASAFEKQLADDLLSLSLSQSFCSSFSVSDFNGPDEIKEIIQIDLKKHLNSKNFGKRVLEKFTVVEGDHKNCLFVEDLPSGDQWKVGNIKFNFLGNSDLTYDNIICDGQKIDCPTDRYDSVMFLGASEQGDFFEEAVFEFTDGYFEKTTLNFSNIHKHNPSFGESVACKLKLVKFQGEVPVYVPGTLHLYAKSYKIKHSGELCSIKLPECMNIHIFAISLGKSL